MNSFFFSVGRFEKVRANVRREQVEMLEGFRVDSNGPLLPPLEDWAFSGRELTGVLPSQFHGEFVLLVRNNFTPPKKKEMCVCVCFFWCGEGRVGVHS